MIALKVGKHETLVDEDILIKYEHRVLRAITPKNKGTYVFVRKYKNGKKEKWESLSRAIMGVTGKEFVDHINHDTLDNRRENLRICTNQQNQGNRKIQGGTSKYKGVCWYKRDSLWMSSMTVNRKSKYLGKYKREEDAALAYNFAALEHFGEFALLNAVGK